MNRTCNQLGYCQRAEFSPCIAECEFACLENQGEQSKQSKQSKLDRLSTVVLWLVIITTSVAMVGVIAGAIYGFGYDFLTRIG